MIGKELNNVMTPNSHYTFITCNKYDYVRNKK